MGVSNNPSDLITHSLPVTGPTVSMKHTDADFCSMGEQDGHLLKLMLTLDPRQRITADDALDHDWFWTTPMPATVEKWVEPYYPELCCANTALGPTSVSNLPTK